MIADGVGSFILVGNGFNNAISGGSGNDRLEGGLGEDVLTGGAGQDVFNTKLSKAANLDTITDFSVKDDSVFLDNAVFKKLGKGSDASPRKLKKDFFAVANKAADKDDFLIYNKKKGVLLYDADGSGSGKAFEISKIQKNFKMKAADFFII